MKTLPRAAAAALTLVLLAAAAPSAAQERPVGFAWEIGLARVDARQLPGAASDVFLTPGVEVATRGRVFAYAGARGMVSALPVSARANDVVEDSAGNVGFRRSGGFPLLLVQAGAGATVRGVTVRGALGSFGVGDAARVYVAAAAGVASGPRVRVEGEVGWNRNWVQTTFQRPFDPGDPSPAVPLYTVRDEAWLPHLRLGLRFAR